MIARITMAIFFILYALTALFHIPVSAIVIGICALVAGIALLAGQ